MADALVADFVLIAVDHIGIRVRVEQGGVFIEGVDRYLVVMIQQRDEFPLRQGQGVIGGRRNVAVDLPIDDPNPAVPRLVFRKHPFHMGLGGRVIGDAELPVRIQLLQNGVQASPQPLLIGVVHRHNYGKDRTVRHPIYLHPDGLDIRRCQPFGLHPCVVEIVGQTPLVETVFHVMRERVGSRVDHVIIHLRVIGGLEEGMGVPPLPGALFQIMDQHVLPGCRDIGILLQVIERDKHGVGITTLPAAVFDEMNQRIHAGGGNIGIFFEIKNRVEKRVWLEALPGAFGQEVDERIDSVGFQLRHAEQVIGRVE